MSAAPRTAKGRRAGKLTEIEVPAVTGGLPGDHSAFRTASGCTVLLALEPARRWPEEIWVPTSALMLWHMSISHRHRYPTWDEIADVRYELVPDGVTMALLLPPRDRYVNTDEHCFHLWQIDDRRVDG